MRLPSTKDLRAFELAAKLGSIKAAADQLCLTPSALSRRIQGLENELGRPLFVRDARGVTLTEVGREYAERLRRIFEDLEQATESVRAHCRQRLKVTAPSGIVSAILPNLQSFEQNLPDVELELHSWSGQRPVGSELLDVDIAFSWGEANWEGWISRNITPRSHITPLCATHLLREGGLMSAEEIAEHPWIISTSFAEAWECWYGAMGLPFPKPSRIIRVNNGQMATEAAIHARGLVMGIGFAGKPSLSVLFGHLANAHAFHAMIPGLGYHMHVRQYRDNPAIEHFSRWFFGAVWNVDGLRNYLASIGK